MQQYLNMLRDVYENGYDHADRTGIGRRSLIGNMVKFDLSDGTLPLITTRQISTDSLIGELLWFISGSSNINELKKLGSSIWDKWAVTEDDIQAFIDSMDFSQEKDGVHEMLKLSLMNQLLDDIGPIYGPNWRNAPAGDRTCLYQIPITHMPSDKLKMYEFNYRQQVTVGDKCDFDQEEFELYCSEQYTNTIDQLNDLVINLKQNPYSSRHIVNAWVQEFIPLEHLDPQLNVLLGRGALAPCHMFFQCFVKPPVDDNERPELSLLVYLRSNDTPIGAPYNIAQYGLLLHLLAHVCDYNVGTLVYTTGDYHIYSNQLDAVKEQLEREPFPLPGVWINPDCKDLFALTKNDIRIEGYQCHPPIKYPVSK